jgi:diguanylate cyclase (GGDEF)-like protein
MKLLDWLQKPAASGIEAGVSEIIKLAIVGLVGAVFNHLIGLFPGVNSSFWGTKPFTVYEIAVWLALAVVASFWITQSVMRRQIVRTQAAAASETSRIKAEADDEISRVKAEAAKKELEAQELSQTDPTTGLLNLRALDDQLPKAFALAKENGQPLTMVIFDIDGFKEVNTLVGHDRANIILKAVAATLSPRAPDKAFRYPENVEVNKRVVFRYGGDEFIIIAFNTTVIGGTDPAKGKRVENGTRMAEVLQGNLWSTDFKDLQEKRKERGLENKLTVSAGIADTNPTLDPKDTFEELRHRAEMALIEAKRLNAVSGPKGKDFKGTVVPYNIDLEYSP